MGMSQVVISLQLYLAVAVIHSVNSQLLCGIIVNLHIYGFIIAPHNILVGQIAQLVEHCTGLGIAEIRVRIAVQARNFQAFLATT